MTRLTMKTVNKALASLGDIQLHKGHDYFWFYGDDLDPSKEQGVYGGVNNLNDLTLDQWIDEAKDRLNEEELEK